MARPLLIISLILAGILIPAAAMAHFKLNLNVRIFHVVHSSAGIDLYLRTPMSYLVADRVGAIGADGLPEPAPFTTNRIENGNLMHLVAPDSLRADPKGLGQLAAEASRLESEGGQLRAEIVGVRVHPIGSEPGFATRAEAETAMAEGAVFPDAAGETYVGDAIADIHLRFITDKPIDSYQISMLNDPGLPGQETTANLVLDYGDKAPRTFRATGLMHDPIEISNSTVAAASTFVIEGIRHILEGLDHVLFVLCMVIGAPSLRALLARVTGFTFGHTVTLIMGFFGLSPSAPWFIPAVETAIALSIIYAAADAVLRRSERADNDLATVGVTSAIGLLHGFGFSFMLQQILRVDAENVWQSLLAFNIGVELGQLAIVALVWPAVVLLRHMPEHLWIRARTTVAVSVSVVAVIWTIERAGQIWA